MGTYYVELDGGSGGDCTIEASSLDEALIAALDYAADGDWSVAQEGTEESYGGCGDVDVHVWREDEDGDIVEERTGTYTIPTLGDLVERELDDDGEIVAEQRSEWDIAQLVRIRDEYYYRIDNGGSRGAWDRQCGDGVWRDHPVEGAQLLTRTEARAKALDLGLSPAEVARAVR